MWGVHDGMGWWMLFGGIWMVVFWAAVIWLIAWGISQLSRGGGRETGAGSAHSEGSPLEIAKRRYARGEITREQFEQLRRDLG